MSLKSFPVNEKNVPIGPLNTFLKLVGDVTPHAGNYFLGLSKRNFKFWFLARLYLKDRDFQYHC